MNELSDEYCAEMLKLKNKKTPKRRCLRNGIGNFIFTVSCFVTEVGGLYPQAPSRCCEVWILFFVVLQIYKMIIGLFADWCYYSCYYRRYEERALRN
jgi:hypothetical protein